MNPRSALCCYSGAARPISIAVTAGVSSDGLREFHQQKLERSNADCNAVTCELCQHPIYTWQSPLSLVKLGSTVFKYHLSEVVMISAPQISRVDQRTTTAPAVLVPSAIEKMLTQRQEVQLAKFRTTCTDCVPNY